MYTFFYNIQWLWIQNDENLKLLIFCFCLVLIIQIIPPFLDYSPPHIFPPDRTLINAPPLYSFSDFPVHGMSNIIPPPLPILVANPPSPRPSFPFSLLRLCLLFPYHMSSKYLIYGFLSNDYIERRVSFLQFSSMIV